LDHEIKKLSKILEEMNPYEEIFPDTKLIEEGILDSLTMVLLIGCIEKEFGIKVPEDELKISNFETMGSIMKMIRILK